MIDFLNSLVNLSRRWKDTPDIASPPVVNSTPANQKLPRVSLQSCGQADTLHGLGHSDQHSMALNRLVVIDLLVEKIAGELLAHPSNKTAVVLEIVAHARDLTYRQAMDLALNPSNEQIEILLTNEQQQRVWRGGL
jgi:hypothetical protein